MANILKTSFIDSLIVSGMAASFKKLVQKGTKVVSQPSKKPKNSSISTALMPPIHSPSPTMLSSDSETSDHGDKPSADGQGDDSDPVELTPQKQLSTSFNYHLNQY
jgi:hypothetical protein